MKNKVGKIEIKNQSIANNKIFSGNNFRNFSKIRAAITAEMEIKEIKNVLKTNSQ